MAGHGLNVASEFVPNEYGQGMNHRTEAKTSAF